MSSLRVQKRIMIATLFKEKYKISEIAKIVGVHRNMVRMWVNQIDFADKKRCRDKAKLSPMTKQFIKNEVEDKRGVGIMICTRKLNMSQRYIEANKTIGPTSVGNYIRSTDWGKRSRRCHHKPMLTQKNVDDRLDFGLNVQLEGYCDRTRRGRVLRSHVLWTDESPILLNPKSNRQNDVIRTSDPKKIPLISVPKYSLKVMVAGGICANGVTKLVIMKPNETINTSVYKDKILPVYLDAVNSDLFPIKKKITYQADGAPAHNSSSVMKIVNMNFERVWSKGMWPGNSPDLNVIEHVWAKLQESVFIEPLPTDRHSLIKRIEETWYNLDQSYLENLVESFPNRIDQVINNEGKHTSY